MEWIAAIQLALKAIDAVDDLVLKIWDANKDNVDLDPSIAEDLAKLVAIRDESRSKRDAALNSLEQKIFS